MIRGHLCVGRAHERTWVIAQQMMDEIESGEKPNTFFPVDTIVSQDVIDSLGDVKD